MSVLPKQIHYSKGVLSIEGLPVTSINIVDTPYYCYSKQAFVDNYASYRDNLPDNALICYALKANPNISILKILKDMGSGADVVSGGEIKRAIIAGIEKIVFSGVGKTAEEIKLALENYVHQFNVESIPELLLIQSIAKSMNVVAPISVRVNPEFYAGTDVKITTGSAENKFGIMMDQLSEFMSYLDSSCTKFYGPSFHVGSNIRELSFFEELYVEIKNIASLMREKGYNVERIDVGGGVGVNYSNEDNCLSIESFAHLTTKSFEDFGCELIVEPGRSIIASAGLLIMRIEYVKCTSVGTFLIVNAGMNDFMRLAMYESAFHEIIPVKEPEVGVKLAPVSIVGPVCESSDVFARSYILPDNLQRGDLLALCSIGAYGSSMASNYNSRRHIPGVVVDKGGVKLVRKRQTYDAIMALDMV